MRPRLLILTDRYPIDAARSPAAWMRDHCAALGHVADVEVVSLVRLFPRLKNLLLGGYDRRWFRLISALPATESPFPHVIVHHRRCLTVPDRLGWRVNPLLLRVQQRRWLVRHVGEFQPDVILVHYVHASAAVARSVARQCGIPLWIDENETIAPMPAEGQRSLHDWIIEQLAGADAVLAQCGTQEHALRALLPHGVIHRIPLGITGSPPPTAAAPPPPFALLCVSRLDQNAKNIVPLLEAVALLRARGAAAVRLTIAGDGYQRRGLERLAADLRIDEVVRFTGWLAPAELEVHRGSMHAAVQPSEHESFGLVALEAVAAGLPLVAGARAGVVPDLMAMGAAIVPIPAGTPRAIAGAIEEIQLRYSELQRQAIEARGRVQEQFSWQEHARIHAALLRALPSRSRHRAERNGRHEDGGRG
ncbi:MAG: glycosyltransferase [Bacteroidota bacterium]|jgi:glycosyltransferase involved in cell wall biosynthesis|nr:glycosyltransferase [Bacteroidota bacterium]